MRRDSFRFGQEVPLIVGANNVRLWTGPRKDDSLIDMCSGTGCAGLGHRGNVTRRILERWTNDKVPWNTYAYDTIWREEVEEELFNVLPGYEFAFFSGGAEAADAAVRLARATTERHAVIAFDGCFHGKSVFSESLGRQQKAPTAWLGDYGEMTCEYDAPFDYEAVENVACVLVETVQTRNGVRQASKEFLEGVATMCSSAGALFIVDDISASIRTGYWKSWDAVGAELDPDIVLLGKNYGQGFPVSILAAKPSEALCSLTSGYGGNPLACIAVSETIREIRNQDWLERIRSWGAKFLDGFKVLDGRLGEDVPRTTGVGFWFGIEWGVYEIAELFAKLMLQERFVVGIAGTQTRLSPPFTLNLEYWTKFVNAALRVTDQL